LLFDLESAKIKKMEKFKTSLHEDTRSMQFSLDNKDGREYTLKRKGGVLARSFDGSWKSRAYETLAHDGVAGNMSMKSAGRSRAAQFPAADAAGKIMVDHAFLIDFLNRSGLQEWKLQFRSKHAPPGISDQFQPLQHHGQVETEEFPSGTGIQRRFQCRIEIQSGRLDAAHQ
jgi:hypothetical protein